MKLACHLRELRGDRTLREIADISGIPTPALSMIERGQQLPRDEWLQQLERAYGAPPAQWYAPTVLLAISGDDS